MATGEWAATTRLIDAALAILDEESPMTVRQLFYRLVSAQEVENNRSDYQKVSRMMTKARDDGRCPFDFIVDRSRPEYSPSVFEDPAEYAETLKHAYRKDYWKVQPNYCEVWTEKDAIIGSIEKTTDNLGVRVRVGRGFLSTTKAREIAEYFQTISKPITVFYLGDHDPSGRMIETDLVSRVRGYGADFRIKRLAIFAGDIQKFKLPPLRVKQTDSRADGFLSKYRDRCVELDALPPTELRRRIKEAVEGLLNPALWEAAIQIEQVELQSIQETMARWPKSGKGGRPKTGTSTVPVSTPYQEILRESNTPRQTAAKWQKLAEVPQTTVERYVAETKAAQGEITQAGLRRAHAKSMRHQP